MLWAHGSATESHSWACFPGADPHKVPIDPNGNLTTKTEGTDSWTYSWNAENQLTTVEKNSVEQARFSYDPQGRRVEKIAGGVTISYAYDGAAIVRDRRGGTTRNYVSGPGIDEPLAVDEAGSLTYFHADWLGSVVSATNAAGAATLTRAYDAWGNLQLGADEPGYAFTGREWDPETGLYYYRARYYHPMAGRFISEDPSGTSDGPNRYAYARGNPIRHVDPYGLSVGLPGKVCTDCNCKNTADILVLPEEDPKVLKPAPAPGTCTDADAAYGKGGVMKISNFVTCHIVCDAGGNVMRIACGLPPFRNFGCGDTLPGGWPSNPLCR